MWSAEPARRMPLTARGPRENLRTYGVLGWCRAVDPAVNLHPT
jgi:hypothetical protein